MPITTLASLGMSCQSAHQLASFASHNSDRVTFVKGPFDWLICPPDSLSQWLDAGLPDFQSSEITVFREHAWWDKYKFWFWHGFYTKQDGEKILDIEKNVQRELDKLHYQRERIRNIDIASTLFVISNSQNNLQTDVFSAAEKHRFHFSFDTMKRLQTSLNIFFQVDVNLHIVSREDRLDNDLISLPNLSIIPEEHSEWKGNTADWEQMLNSIV